MSSRVLIAEDDANLRQGLIDLLEGEGYQVLPCSDGRQALDCFHREAPDLVLLDVMMPELSGYDVCREIRKNDGCTPIIMLTAKGEEIDKVVGLELGADDYVTKPFGLHELRARIAAVLRRVRNHRTESPATLPERFPMGQALVDRKTYQVTVADRTHSLTSREMKLLEIFHSQPNQVLSRNDLLNAAWGIDYFGTTRTLDQHIAQLRKKIEPDPSSPQFLLTVHGVGYKFQSPG
jgi:DNA-binding response OmpR family regulator